MVNGFSLILPALALVLPSFTQAAILAMPAEPPTIVAPAYSKPAPPTIENTTGPADPAGLPGPTFEPGPCPFAVPEGSEDAVECGFVIVPEDHGDPGGPTIRIAIAVVKDQSDDHQPDPVMLLHGGPGERTVANALGWANARDR